MLWAGPSISKVSLNSNNAIGEKRTAKTRTTSIFLVLCKSSLENVPIPTDLCHMLWVQRTCLLCVGSFTAMVCQLAHCHQALPVDKILGLLKQMAFNWLLDYRSPWDWWELGFLWWTQGVCKLHAEIQLYSSNPRVLHKIPCLLGL